MRLCVVDSDATKVFANKYVPKDGGASNIDSNYFCVAHNSILVAAGRPADQWVVRGIALGGNSFLIMVS